MYKSSDVDKMTLYGRGFTISKTIEDDNANRDDIEQKIKDKFFDLVIYGSIHRNREYLELCSSVYNKNELFFVDGEDDNPIDYSLVNIGTYFKRELFVDDSNIHPISFAFPEEKISKINYTKTKEVAKTMPSQGQDTFIWNNENDYYQEYNESFFGMTWKKGGWDCLRHYEIIMSYCYPWFTDISECPPRCLTTLPKKKILNMNKFFYDKKILEKDIKFYYENMDELFEYGKKNLTTKVLASTVLSHCK
jgi:hypothetical protein